MMSSNIQHSKNASGNRLDIAWEHGMKVDNNLRKIMCKYCNKIISGTAYSFKHHLACTRKNVEACKNVPVEVKEEGMAETVPDKKGKRVIESFGIRTINTTESILNQNFEKKLRDEACPTSC